MLTCAPAGEGGNSEVAIAISRLEKKTKEEKMGSSPLINEDGQVFCLLSCMIFYFLGPKAEKQDKKTESL